MPDRTTMACAYCGFRHPWDRENFPDRMVAMCVDCFGGADKSASTETDTDGNIGSSPTPAADR